MSKSQLLRSVAAKVRSHFDDEDAPYHLDITIDAEYCDAHTLWLYKWCKDFSALNDGYTIVLCVRADANGERLLYNIRREEPEREEIEYPDDESDDECG